MAKVSIGLRGWRFEESEVFDEDGDIRPIGTMPDETRRRIVRLSSLLGEPCQACWLVHGDEEIHRCNVGRVVYGEPLGEVLVCSDHEPDFLYWFREAGGSDYAGDVELQDRFHEWFADGGRAPEGYGGIDHVDTDPDRIPDAPERAGELPSLEEELERLDDEDLDELGVDLSELDV